MASGRKPPITLPAAVLTTKAGAVTAKRCLRSYGVEWSTSKGGAAM